MSDRNPKIILAGCAVGGTGVIFASKKFCLQLKEELEQDITIKVKESLTNDINPELQHEFKDIIDLETGEDIAELSQPYQTFTVSLTDSRARMFYVKPEGI